MAPSSNIHSNVVDKTAVTTPPALQIWRTQVLEGVLRGTLIFLLLALVAGTNTVLQDYRQAGSPHDQRLVLATAVVSLYILLTMLLTIVTVRRHMAYSRRAAVFLLAFYLVGAVGLAMTGLRGDGRIFLFTYIMLTAIFFDRRLSLWALLLSITTLILIASLLVTGIIHLPTGPIDNSTNPFSWLSGGLVFIWLAVTAIISLTYLMRRLEHSLAQTQSELHQRQQAEQSARESQEHLQQVNRILRTLSEVNQIIVRQSDRQQMLQSACDALVNYGGYAAVWVGLAESETTLHRVATAATHPTLLAHLNSATHLDTPACVRLAWQQRTPYMSQPQQGETLCADCTHCPLIGMILPSTAVGGSCTALPLTLRQDYGILVVYDTAKSLDNDISLLRELANDLAYALEKIEIEAQHRARENELAALYQIGLDLSARLDLPVLLHTIIERAAHLLAAPMGGLYLLQPDGQTLELVVIHHLPDYYLGMQLKLGQGLSGKVAQTGRPLIIDDYSTWAERAEFFREGSFRAIIGVPILWQERVIGVINLHDTQPGRFMVTDIETLKLFSIHAAIAIENARLFHTLQNREAQFRAVFEQNRDGIAIANPDGRYVMVNPAFCTQTGYSQEELQTMFVTDLLLPGIQPELFRHINQTGTPGQREAQLRRKDGRTFYALISGAPLHLETGHFTLGIVHDITQQKRNETILRESEERFRALVENAAEGIVVLDANGLIQYIGPAEERLMGSKPEALLGQSAFANFHPDDLPHVWQVWHDGLQQPGVIVMLEYRARHEDGSWRSFEATGHNLLHDPRVAGIVVNYRDITARKQAEETIRQQEQDLRVLVEQMPIGIVTLDLNGIITDINPRGLEILGSPGRAHTIGLNALTLPPLVHAGISAVFIRVLQTGQQEALETWYTSLWGTDAASPVAYLLIRVVPHFNGSNQQIGLIAMIEDLTQRMQAEEGMRQMQKLESLGVLAGGVAHDFNNLLVAMLGQTSLALAKMKSNCPARPHIEKAITAAEHAAQLTQQLLAYSGRGRFQVAPLDFNQLIKENLNLFEATIPRHIHLQTQFADTLPLLVADVSQMQQVVMNLIINAAEAIGDQPGTISVTTNLYPESTPDRDYWQYVVMPAVAGPYVTLEIGDTGAGILPEMLPRIFDPFFTTKQTGHGLGLAAVLGIIKGHQGGLWVHSEMQQGTVFRLLLPPQDTRPTKPVKSRVVVDTAVSIGLVLVIDDETAVYEAIHDMLSLEGIRTLSAANGQQGLTLYRQHQTDISLILLDLSMPGWSGNRTLQELRQINPAVPIILSSGYSENEAREQFADLGPTGFLPKPYATEDLVHIVKQFCSHNLSGA